MLMWFLETNPELVRENMYIIYIYYIMITLIYSVESFLSTRGQQFTFKRLHSLSLTHTHKQTHSRTHKLTTYLTLTLTSTLKPQNTSSPWI